MVPALIIELWDHSFRSRSPCSDLAVGPAFISLSLGSSFHFALSGTIYKGPYIISLRDRFNIMWPIISNMAKGPALESH